MSGPGVVQCRQGRGRTSHKDKHKFAHHFLRFELRLELKQRTGRCNCIYLTGANREIYNIHICTRILCICATRL